MAVFEVYKDLAIECNTFINLWSGCWLRVGGHDRVLICYQCSCTLFIAMLRIMLRSAHRSVRGALISDPFLVSCSAPFLSKSCADTVSIFTMRNEYRLSLAVPAFGPGDFRRMSCCIVRLQLHTQYCVPFRVPRAKAPFPVSSGHCHICWKWKAQSYTAYTVRILPDQMRTKTTYLYCRILSQIYSNLGSGAAIL